MFFFTLWLDLSSSIEPILRQAWE